MAKLESTDREDLDMSTQNTVDVRLTESELRLIKNALRSFVTDFGHDEADILHETQLLLAKLQAISVTAPVTAV
jgi:hypothetical protein